MAIMFLKTLFIFLKNNFSSIMVKKGVDEAGFEPATSRLSAGCSSQPKLPVQSNSATDVPELTMTVGLNPLECLR